MTTEVKAIKHKDVRGNELMYLVIGTEEKTVIINIGQKTFDSINEMEYGKPEPEAQLKIDTELKKNLTTTDLSENTTTTDFYRNEKGEHIAGNVNLSTGKREKIK